QDNAHRAWTAHALPFGRKARDDISQIVVAVIGRGSSPTDGAVALQHRMHGGFPDGHAHRGCHTRIRRRMTASRSGSGTASRSMVATRAAGSGFAAIHPRAMMRSCGDE